MTQDEMGALIDAHIATEKIGDLDAAVAVYTDDVEHDVVGAPGGPLYGRAAARQRYEQLLQQVHTDELRELRRYYGDSFCVVEHECVASVLGSFAGIAGDGRQISFRMLHVFEFRAGRISRENVWMDTATVMAQLREPSAAGVGAD
ncbi:MAG: nuclear transport factor 2 family protein [Pseudonocardiaceae bacterium]